MHFQAAILTPFKMAEQDSSGELEPVAYMRPRGGYCGLWMPEAFTPVQCHHTDPEPSLLLPNLPVNGVAQLQAGCDGGNDTEKAGHPHASVSIEGLNELPHSRVDGEPHEWPCIGTTADGWPAYLSTLPLQYHHHALHTQVCQELRCCPCFL